MWTRIPADKSTILPLLKRRKIKSDDRVAPDAVLIAGVIADGAYDFLTAVKTPLEYLTSQFNNTRARLAWELFNNLKLGMFYELFDMSWTRNTQLIGYSIGSIFYGCGDLLRELHHSVDHSRNNAVKNKLILTKLCVIGEEGKADTSFN
jgi:hypothetical protein